MFGASNLPQITQLGVTEPELNSSLFDSIALLTTPLHYHHPLLRSVKESSDPKAAFWSLAGPFLTLLPVVTVAALAQDSAFLKSKVVGLGREDAGTAGREVET